MRRTCSLRLTVVCCCCVLALACVASVADNADAHATTAAAAAQQQQQQNKSASVGDDDLPAGVVRGPLLYEHSLQPPFVSDWWEEGVSYFMLGGSAVATERSVRLTSHELDAHGFAFNTAAVDHDDWELRVKVSVRPPAPAIFAAAAAANSGNNNGTTAEVYQGGDGMALWYLQQPIGDDHQHVLKYSKPLSPEMAAELVDADTPWVMADLLLNDDVDDAPDDLDDVDEDDLTAQEKEQRVVARERRALKRRKREELYRRLFKRGTSVDDTAHEPRIMGVKYSDFAHGFALVLDSVGVDDDAAQQQHNNNNKATQPHQRHRHTPSVYLLLNVPEHAADKANTSSIVNNFDASRGSFRQAPRLLHCDYNFRQAASRKYVPKTATSNNNNNNNGNNDDEDDRVASALLNAPEEPVEVVVRYYKKKLSVLLRREAAHKRELQTHTNTDNTNATAAQVGVVRTYVETLCGELYPVHLPRGYHFGLSASTGHRSARQRRQHARHPHHDNLHHGDGRHNNNNTGNDDDDNDYYDAATGVQTHVDVHDVLQMQLRELGKDAKAMGYSKTVPLEPFDYARDRREREHFSRRIPDAPDEDTPSPY